MLWLKGITVKLEHLILKGINYKIKNQLLGKVKYIINSTEIIYTPSQEENAPQDAPQD